MTKFLKLEEYWKLTPILALGPIEFVFFFVVVVGSCPKMEDMETKNITMKNVKWVVFIGVFG